MSIINAAGDLFSRDTDRETCLKQWELFMNAQPKCLLSPEELTELIREEEPEYHFEPTEEMLRQGEQLRDQIREAVRDNAIHFKQSEYGALACRLFSKRDESSFGSYIENFMPERLEEMRTAAELTEKKDPRAEEMRRKLHKAVMEHYMNNEEVAKLKRELGTMPLEEAAKNWPKLSAVIYLSDAQNTVEPYRSWYSDEELRRYADAMTPVFDEGFILEGKMSLKASSIGPMVDEQQLLKLDSNQLYALSQKADVFDSPRNNPFEDARVCAAMLPNNVIRRINKAFGDDNRTAPLMRSILGEPLDTLDIERSVFRRQLPMYAVSPKHPEKDPLLVFVDAQGHIHTGKDAKALFADAPMPKKPEAPQKRTGIGAWFSKVFNTASHRQYKADQARYEAEMKDYKLLSELKQNVGRLDSPAALDRAKESMFREKFGRSSEEYAREQNLGGTQAPEPAEVFERKLRSAGLPEEVRRDLKLLYDCLQEEKAALEDSASLLSDRNASADLAFLRNTGAAAIICHKSEKLLLDEVDALAAEQPLHPQLSPALAGLLPKAGTADPKAAIQSRLHEQVLRLADGELLPYYQPTQKDVQELTTGSAAQKARTAQDILLKAGQEKERRTQSPDAAGLNKDRDLLKELQIKELH